MKLAFLASEIILCVAKHSEAQEHLRNVMKPHQDLLELLFNSDFFFSWSTSLNQSF